MTDFGLYHWYSRNRAAFWIGVYLLVFFGPEVFHVITGIAERWPVTGWLKALSLLLE